jgi:hypothetical protein
LALKAGNRDRGLLQRFFASSRGHEDGVVLRFWRLACLRWLLRRPVLRGSGGAENRAKRARQNGAAQHALATALALRAAEFLERHCQISPHGTPRPGYLSAISVIDDNLSAQ